MSLGLPVSRIVNVAINMSPVASRPRDFGTLLVLGSSAVIDTSERLRFYATLDEVAADFGTSAKEYTSAQLYFSQSPRPTKLYIGRWARTASSGLLYGAVLTAAQQALSNFTAITAGTLTISVDGTPLNLTAINLGAVANLNGVASAITTKLTGAATCVWDAVRRRFVITSTTTGAASTVGYASASPLATAMGLTQAAGASVPIDGIAAESAAAVTALMANKSNDWYGLMFADMLQLSDQDHLDVAAFIEGATPTRIYGVGVADPTALDSNDLTDVGSLLKALNYSRTFCAFSTSQVLLVASIFGRAFTVNFAGSKTTMTLKFKQLPGVAAETLTSSQATTLAAKNYNVFVNYANDTAIVQEGVMANGDYFDERHGLDWLQNDIETRVFNRLYTSTTKVPQTDAGQTELMTVVEDGLAQAVENGLVAPGKWNADGFGQLVYGDMLPKGYYIYSAPMADQSQADRDARKAQPIQCAIKLAGAVHFAAVTMNVNR